MKNEVNPVRVVLTLRDGQQLPNGNWKCTIKNKDIISETRYIHYTVKKISDVKRSFIKDQVYQIDISYVIGAYQEYLPYD